MMSLDTNPYPRMPQDFINGDAMTLVQFQHSVYQIFGIIRDLSPLMSFHLTTFNYHTRLSSLISSSRQTLPANDIQALQTLNSSIHKTTEIAILSGLQTSKVQLSSFSLNVTFHIST